VPVLWTTVDPDILPDVAKSLQYDHHDLGNRYRAEGFYGIIKLNRYRDDYNLAVNRLARRILTVARETRLRNDIPADYHSLPSAFAKRGRGSMQITVLALDRSTLPDGRAPDYYGTTPLTWSPFRPDCVQSLADYSQDVAKSSGCEPVVGTFDEHHAGWSGNGRLVPPGLCLIDAWATVSSAHEERLRLLDEVEEPWVSILVPWNSRDSEMSEAEQRLRTGLATSLRRKLESVPYRCRRAATGVPTLQEFGQLLAEMAMIMLKRFRKDDDVPAYPPDGPVLERPRLRRAYPEDPGGSK
jgi:FxsC-like protein